MSDEITLDKTLDELKAEADSLGIAYNKNIGADKLTAKIDEFYAAEEAKSTISSIGVVTDIPMTTPAVKKSRTIREMAAEAKAKAMVRHVVTITDNDQRENNLTSVVSVTCGNEYFDLGTKRIPLNIPVELEQGFIDVLTEIIYPMHVIDHKTGQSVRSLRRRYSIAFEQVK